MLAAGMTRFTGQGLVQRINREFLHDSRKSIPIFAARHLDRRGGCVRFSSFLLRPGRGRGQYQRAGDRSTGALIQGAEVAATQTETHFNRSVNTDAQGRYNLANLPVGPYILAIKTQGFKTYEQKGIVLEVGNNIQVNAAMQVGGVSESVEVSAGASMVETKENAVSQVINQRQVNDLPLNGRQATQLILISGAATQAPADSLYSTKNHPSSVTMSVAGGQANATNYLLDGGNNTQTFTNLNLPFPFPDALQEFSVETSSLPARNGSHPGGLVNVVTKSGTNDLHGDLFDYLRNGDL